MADYRHGLLPSGAAAATLPNIAALPFPVTVNHTASSLATVIGSTKPIIINGDDPRVVPHAIMCLAFASTWDYDITLTGPAGIAHTWTGTIARGISKTINDGGSSETGVAKTTIHSAYSRALVAGTLTFPVNTARIDDSSTSSTPNHQLQIQINPIGAITFYPQLSKWICQRSPFLFFAGVVDGSDSATVADNGSGTATSGLTIGGADWELTGNDVVTFSGTIEPSAWLA